MKWIIFLIQCRDRTGLVAGISTFFFEQGFNILNCQQFTDVRSGAYFMRVKLDLETLRTSRAELENAFAKYAMRDELRWSVHYSDQTQRTVILVTKASHCLYDLLLRQQEGEIKCEIPAVVSNHSDLESVAAKFDVPFYHLPVGPGKKDEQEQKLLDLLASVRADLLVLARYMQILSPSFVAAYEARVINIHHAFLPAFQGASPYPRAYERGVKMIGATAHYVTSELDEGPIIEQDVARVTHEDSPEDLSRIGRDVERLVLARAVKAHLEHRVIVHGRRTIVFSGGA